MTIEPNDGTMLGGLLAAIAAVVTAVRWWYHVKKLEHADRVDGSVSHSIGFVLNELRAEIDRLKAENASLRIELEQLRRDREPYGL